MSEPNSIYRESRQSRKSDILGAVEILKRFFMDDFGNILWLIDYSFLCMFYYCILSWFPFYFMQLGLASFVFLVCSMYSIFTPVGTALLELLNSRYGILRRNISICFIVLSALVHTLICFVEESDENLLLYIGLVALDGVFQGGTFVSISSWELSKRTKNNKEKYLVMSAIRLIYQIFIFASMVLIGFLMQISNCLLNQQKELSSTSWLSSSALMP